MPTPTEVSGWIGQGAYQGINQNAANPPTSGNQSSGFLNWLGNNYVGVTQAAANISCIFNPEKCAGAGGSTTIVQPPPQEPSGPSPYVIIAAAVIVAALLLILLKR